jgi:hypothetical protein
MVNTPSDCMKGVASALFDRFGEPARIATYTDQASGRGIDLAFYPDCPHAGLTTASTIGLCDHDLGAEAAGGRVEIVAAFASEATDFANVIGSCALAVIGQGWPLRRGAVHTGVLEIYRLSRTLPHILFMMPSLWGERTAPIVADGRVIHWFMAVPIAETEREYAAREGAAALEDLLAQAGIDMFDFDRASVAAGRGGFATVG